MPQLDFSKQAEPVAAASPAALDFSGNAEPVDDGLHLSVDPRATAALPTQTLPVDMVQAPAMPQATAAGEGIQGSLVRGVSALPFIAGGVQNLLGAREGGDQNFAIFDQAKALADRLDADAQARSKAGAVAGGVLGILPQALAPETLALNAVSHGTNLGAEALQKGKSVGTAEGLLGVGTGAAAVQNALPASLGGNIIARMLAGGAIAGGTGAAEQAAEHQIAPDVVANPTLDSTVTNAGIGAVLAAILGHGTTARTRTPEEALVADPVPQGLPRGADYSAKAEPVRPVAPDLGGAVRVSPSGEAVTPQQGASAFTQAVQAGMAPQPARLPAPVVAVDRAGNAATNADTNAAQAAQQQAIADRQALGITPDIERSQGVRWSQQDQATREEASRQQRLVELDKAIATREAQGKPARGINAKPDESVDDALTFLAKSGGLDRRTFVKEGVDPAVARSPQNRTRGGASRPLFRAQDGGGLSLDDATRILWQHGYIPEHDNHQALDLIMEGVNQDKASHSIHRQDQGDLLALEQARKDTADHQVPDYTDVPFNRKPADARFSFAGERAQTADRGALAQAQQMEAMGRDSVPDRYGNQPGSPEDTHIATGWHRGVDGKWRFEIDDSKAIVDADGLRIDRQRGTASKLGDVFHHPALMSAYPELANTQVRINPEMKGLGAYNAGSNRIDIRPPSEYQPSGDGSLKSVLLHEIQHAIQNHEGFARGGNSTEARTLPEFEASLRQHMETHGGELPAWQSVAPDHPAAVKAARAVYQRLAGEVEARNTQRRMKLDATERRATPPSETADTPRSQQIVRFNGGDAHDAGEPHADQQAIEKYNAKLSSYIGKAIDIAPAAHVPDATRRALAAFDDAFGSRSIVVRNGSPDALDFNGVTLRDGVRLINEDATSPVLTVAGHEMIHQLRADAPELYAELADEVKRQGRLESYAAVLNARARASGEGRDVHPDLIAEELAADAAGDALSDPDFIEQLAQRNPGLFRRLATKLMDFLARVSRQLRSLGSSPFLADVDAYRAKLADVLERYASRQHGDPDGAPEAALSRKPVADQTDTPAFKKWFGDSKVVDAEGKPLVVYHGTKGDFDTFDLGRLTSRNEGPGMYFTTSKDIAAGYGHGGRVMSVYLSMKNPLPYNAPSFKGAKLTKLIQRIADLEASTDSSDIRDGFLSNYGDTYSSVHAAARSAADLIAQNETAVDQLSDLVGSGVDARHVLQATKEVTGHDGIVATGFSNEGSAENTIYVAFRPEQIKSATDNAGTFDADNPSILFSRKPVYTPEQKEFMRKAGMSDVVDERGAIQSALDALRGVPRPDGDAFRQGAINQFHGIKRAVDEKGGIAPENDPFLAAEMIQTASTMEAVLRFGAPELHQGVLRVNRGVPGLLDALTPVRDQLPQWLGWMVAGRARVLKNQGRENAMSDADIAAGLSLSKGHEAEFKKAAAGYVKLKNAILDLAEQSGIIDPDARKAWDHAEYIPFYRDMDTGMAGPGTRQGIANQSSGVRTLKGGTSPLKDPLGNIIANFTRLVDASTKNRAMQLAVDQLGAPYFRKAALDLKPEIIPLDQVRKHLLAQGVDPALLKSMPADALRGVAKMLSVKAPEGDDIVRVMRNGKAQYYHVDDPLLLRSLTAFNEGGTHWSLKPLVWAKQLLTAGATGTPDFLIRNALRDTGEATVTSKDRFMPVLDTVRGAIDSLRESELAQDLMMSGGAFHGGLFHTGNNEDTSKAIARALRKHGLTDSAAKRYLGTLINPKRLWDTYRSVAEATEMGSRVSLARLRLKAGASPVEAMHEAKDFLNFQRRGDDKFVQAFSKMIPFLNARVQGADRLYRVGTTKGRRGKVAARLAVMAMLTTLLYWWNQEEHKDAYDEIPDWDKDANWHIAPGTPYYTRIPKPFELGLIGGTVPERAYQAMRYQLTDGQEGDRGKQTWDAFMRGMGQALGLNPIPQAAMPIVEDVANKSLYFDTPIEGMGDRYKVPSDRYGPTTSPTMRHASKAMASMVGEDNTMSPKRMEHMWNGYTAGMGGYLLQGADWVTRQIDHAPETPAMALRDYPLVGTVARGGGPARSTRYVDEFYDLADQAQTHSSQIKQAIHDHDTATAAKLSKQWGWLVGDQVGSRRAKEGFMHQGVRDLNQVSKQLSEISKSNAAIYADPKMNADAKRQMLDVNLQKRNALVRKAVLQMRYRQRQAAG